MEKIAAALLIATGAASALTDAAGSFLADLSDAAAPAWLLLLERYGIAAVCAFIAWIFIKRDGENFRRREVMHKEIVAATKEQTSKLSEIATHTATAIEESSRAAFQTARRLKSLTEAINDKLPCVRDNSGSAGQNHET